MLQLMILLMPNRISGHIIGSINNMASELGTADVTVNVGNDSIITKLGQTENKVFVNEKPLLTD